MLLKQKIKDIQSLGQKKFRQREGLFIAEGPKLVSELLTADASRVMEVFALHEWIGEHEKLLKNTTITEITEAELGRISQLTTPNSVLAVVRQYEDETEITAEGKITLVLDGIQDPGNLGTIIRTADWFAVGQIVCSPDSADVYNPKVVQATMGSIARVKVVYRDLEEWLTSQNAVPIYATVLEGEDVSSVRKIQEGIIIFGNESKGIRPGILERANQRICIRKKTRLNDTAGQGKAESLNAAVASGIILSWLLT